MYHLFDPNESRPTGWLRRQLRIQADGLSGNLDKIWPDVRDSAWIGGDKDGWERVPYWLDGFIPLAWLLEDEDMKARAKKYVDGIVAQQQADGWICPCSEDARAEYDVWAYLLIGKVLALYCDFTGDKKVELALYKAMQCLNEQMQAGKVRLFNWGQFRWFEGLIPLGWLYERYPEAWIKDLAALLRAQGTDYPALEERWKTPLNIWTLETHIVNLMMMLKYGALTHTLLGVDEADMPERLWKVLDKYNGTAVGTITGDECLAGIGNTHGTELCSVAELMYSCEVIYAHTGNGLWMDRLEKAAFNALPATISDDMWTHQYDQTVNQIACVNFPNKPIFRTNNGESGLFGLEPGFGCCTANFNQAWPKLAMNVFMRSRSGILCAMLLPAELNTTVKGAKVRVAIETEYPFRHSGRITVETDRPVTFELKVRVPRWAKDAALTGGVRKGDHLVIKQEWQGSTALQVTYTDTPHLVTRPRGMKVAQYGPLVFALPVDAVWEKKEFVKDGVERKFPYCDYELHAASQWRYGFADGTFEVVEGEGGDVPFSAAAPRLALKARLAPVDWDFADGYGDISAEKPKNALARGPVEEKLLVPYGAAKLRITEMVKTK